MNKDEFLAKADEMIAEKDTEIAANDQVKNQLVADKQALSDMKDAFLAYGNDQFQAGKDSIQLPAPSDPAAQYSQQQMNDAVNAGQKQITDVLQPQIDALNSQVADLQAASVQAAADRDAAVAAKAASDQAFADYKAANLAQANS